ncbi:MAG: isochorismate synthase [Actinomycetia bacterium]|nr:isochorismate synthase [Actinomycetes bacterium]
MSISGRRGLLQGQHPTTQELFGALPGEPSVAWVRHGQGLVGWGVAARQTFVGEERFSRAQRWFTDWADSLPEEARDPLGTPPVAFASFTFDDQTPGSVVVIPQTLVTWRHGSASVASFGAPAEEPSGALTADLALPTTGGTGVRWRDDDTQAKQWTDAVRDAVKRIAAGELDKVVLARAVAADFEQRLDLRPVLGELAERYPQCWTFHVDGLIGATPELLIRKASDNVYSRVLAGTIRAAASDADNQVGAEALKDSAKDLAEHEYAVRSVAHALAAHCTDLQMADAPTVLTLANVQHLVTDVSARLADGGSALALAASLHPTAAVCGTPTERAEAVISELETINRARYSGPVGWFNGAGDGEFGIALRCAELSQDRRSARLFAGCGLVADSRASDELAESIAKLDAMRDAFTAQSAESLATSPRADAV